MLNGQLEFLTLFCGLACLLLGAIRFSPPALSLAVRRRIMAPRMTMAARMPPPGMARRMHEAMARGDPDGG